MDVEHRELHDDAVIGLTSGAVTIFPSRVRDLIREVGRRS